MADRREVLKGAIAGGLLGAGVLSYLPVLNRVFRPKWERVFPDPQSGKDVRYVYSSCLGCNVRCGIRVRVRKVGNEEIVDRIEGNPYHPYNRAASFEKQTVKYDALPYSTPVKEAYKWFGSLCPRGQDGIHYLYDPYRVLKPLKRAGKRGSGKWKVISWEQLIREIVEGGVIEETGEKLPGLKDLFVYGKLKEAGFDDPNSILKEMKEDTERILKKAKEGEDPKKLVEEFKAKWSNILGERGLKLEDILIDPDRPDLGTKANQVVYMRGRGQGHTDYFSARWIAAFGSVNWLRHTSACQNAYYTADKHIFGYHDIQADIRSAKVVIMAGASMGRLHPGATGQGLLIERAVRGEVKVYYVNPVAPRTLASDNIVWVPIKPSTDGALAMGMLRWIFENERFNREYLEIPNEESAKRKGYPVPSNATWLVITEGPGSGEFLKAKDLGLEDSETPLVFSNGEFVPADKTERAELFYEGEVYIKGEKVKVKTALQILKEEAFSKSIEEWSDICGVPVHLIVSMAKDFTDNAPYSATYIHRGVAMHPQGEYNVMAYRMLDILIGNYHRKGGLLARAGHTKYNKYIYHVDKKKFGEPPKWGPPIDRCKYGYEKTLEYWIRLREGKPYPTKRPWYPLSAEESYTEMFAGMFYSYPYSIKALILFYANPVLSSNYGIKFLEVLSDPEKLPLFIGITTTINETFMYADYIVPDTTYLETGTSGIQYLYATSGGVLLAEAWRTPAVMPKTEKIGTCPDGHPRYASFWEFFIDLGKSLGMPGFGEGAVKGLKHNEGRSYSLNCFWEYILRVYANGAYHAMERGLVPKDVPPEEVEFVNNNYPVAKFRDILSEEEWKYVAYCLARGGVFTDYESSFDEKGISKRKIPEKRKTYKHVLMVWSEDIAKTVNTITGEKFWGGARYYEPKPFADNRSLPDLFKEYPYRLMFSTGPLYTKHRSQFYYYIAQITPENFAVIHPETARELGVSTGDVIEVDTPTGKLEVPVLVEPTVERGSIHIPYGFGRWSDTVVSKPKYFIPKEEKVAKTLQNLPDKVDIPEEAVNPVRSLPKTVKRILFTKSPAQYYENGLYPDKWRFNGVSPNPVEMYDPSLDKWPLLSWLGAAQVFYYTPAQVKVTGKKHKFEVPYLVW
ncbi:tetrathionate reductase alpha subunit precursor [Hydrogenivirga caldilitoris]|uniref:Tetrathionate reductase alpha subunit n=1 Tax=Hydrogenivirga caldilitoris TaxID=246264 RepID=A0A497XSP5_9AQUI|nr:molybdopterin-dependent oxidoreductase [Hydrogenivirga caldilitoris]RLJ71180.1 tetrathionate reductase alpha subunit precursor [Hydrogenivirga caldilitoris]